MTMRSVKVLLSKSTVDGQFRILRLSYEGHSPNAVDTNVWNLVMQILRLKEKPEAQTSTGFPYGFPFAFELEK